MILISGESVKYKIQESECRFLSLSVNMHCFPHSVHHHHHLSLPPSLFGRCIVGGPVGRAGPSSSYCLDNSWCKVDLNLQPALRGCKGPTSTHLLAPL